MTYAEAKVEIYSVAFAACVANAQAIGGAIDVRWPGMSRPSVFPPTNGYYARASLTTIRDIQASLSKLNGVSRYEFLGQFMFQVFSPIGVPGSLENGNLFAVAIRDAYRAATGEVFYTNQLMREVGNNDTHYISNVIVTCTFDHFQ